MYVTRQIDFVMIWDHSFRRILHRLIIRKYVRVLSFGFCANVVVCFQEYSRNSFIQLDDVLSRPAEIFENDDPYVLRGFGEKSKDVFSHFLDQTFRQIYLHMLLRIPSMYFTRISRMSKVAIVRSQGVEELMARAIRNKSNSGKIDYFKKEWEVFVRGVVKEWETFNIVSVLLLSWVNFLNDERYATKFLFIGHSWQCFK